MKTRKLRGHNRIHKEIEHWKQENLNLNLDYLESSEREYCKVWVSPFSDISLSAAGIPKPKHKNRKLIFEGLLAIFTSWEKQLKALNEPYYLAIWLFEPHIEKSQVVCAIGSLLSFYDITFFRPKEQRNLATVNYGKFKNELDTFNWVYALDEDYFSKEDIERTVEDYMTKEDYTKMQKWYKNKLKNDLRTTTNPDGQTTYFYKLGSIFIGTRN